MQQHFTGKVAIPMTLATMPKPTARELAPKERAATMKALVYQAVGKKALLDRPKPEIAAPTDAIIRISVTYVCRSDLWPYRGFSP